MPALDDKRLRALTLHIPAALDGGTVALVDQGSNCSNTVSQTVGQSDCSEVLTPSLTAKDIPSGGEPVVFEPLSGVGGSQQIEAFISNSAGMPSEVVNLASFTTPDTPAIPAPKITQIVRSGSNTEIVFEPGKIPTSAGSSISLVLTTSTGQRFEQTINFGSSSMRPYDPGSSHATGDRSHGAFKITVAGVDPTATIHVKLAALVDGQLGNSTSNRQVKPIWQSIGERTLRNQLIPKVKLKL